MKLIIAIIRPEKFEDVQDALDAKQVHLMTATDVRGCGSQRGYTENFRGNKGVIRLLIQGQTGNRRQRKLRETGRRRDPQGGTFRPHRRR